MLEVITGAAAVHTEGINLKASLATAVVLIGILVGLLTLYGIGHKWFDRRYGRPRRLIAEQKRAAEQRAITQATIKEALGDAVKDGVGKVEYQLRRNGGSTFADDTARNFAQIGKRLDDFAAATGREFKEVKGHLQRQDEREEKDNRETNKRIDDVWKSLHDQGALPRTGS